MASSSDTTDHRLRCMNELWLEQARPLVRDLRKAFDHDTEMWWQNGLRRYSSNSLRANQILAESQYVTHDQPAPISDAYATGETLPSLRSRVSLGSD